MIQDHRYSKYMTLNMVSMSDKNNYSNMSLVKYYYGIGIICKGLVFVVTGDHIS